MLKTMGLVAVLVLGSALPAAADDSMCSAPIAPAAVDGNNATKDQISGNLADVKTFLKQSDDYQGCLLREVDQHKADWLKAKKDMDQVYLQDVDVKIKANQGLKEKVGAEYNAAAHAYMAKHPGG